MYDLRVPLSSDGTAPPLEVLETFASAGYSGVALERTIKEKVTNNHVCGVDVGQIKVKSSQSDALRVAKKGTENMLKIYTRLTIVLHDQSQMYALNAANPVLQGYDVVAVQPETDKLWQQCCASVEADIISFDFSRRVPFHFRRQQTNAAIERGVQFEISYSAGLRDSASRRSLLSNASALVRVCKGKNVVLSSEALSAMDVRGPYDIMNFVTLFGMTMQQGKDSVSKNALSALHHGRGRKAYRTVVEVVAGEDEEEPSLKWEHEGYSGPKRPAGDDGNQQSKKSKKARGGST